MKRTREGFKHGAMKRVLAAILVIGIVAAGTAWAALSTKVIFSVQTTYTGSTGLGETLERLNLDYGVTLANGTGAGQANLIFSDSRSLADDANEVLDFYASGTLTDAFGTDLTMTKLKLLIIVNTSTEATLKIGGGAAAVNLFADASDILTLPPDGRFLWSDPNGLTITADKDLNLLHGGQGTAALVYKVIAVGLD